MVRVLTSFCIVFGLVLSSGTAGDEPSVRWESASSNQLYQLTLAPGDGATPLNQYHHWTLTLRDARGNAVYPAQVLIGGGMFGAGHGHGLPSQPQLGEYLGDGVYRIDGVLFNMAGNWTLMFDISAAAGRDRARVDFRVDY